MIQPYIEQITGVFLAIFNYLELKVILGFLLSLYSFFFSVSQWQLMLAVMFLVSFDMITGIAAAKLSGEAIESKKACRTAFKLGIYGILVSSAHLTDFAVGMPAGWIHLDSGMTAFLAATELISVIENAGKMGYAVPKRMLNQLQEFRDGK